MNIFVDGDSCPLLIRPVIQKAAIRREIPTFFVANRNIKIEKNPWISFQLVESVEGAADDWIVSRVQEGDLVVTRDIPLAARLLELKAYVINDRGFEFTSENIKGKLSERDIMKSFYESGLAVQGFKNYGKKELFEFSNCFDRLLTRIKK